MFSVPCIPAGIDNRVPLIDKQRVEQHGKSQKLLYSYYHFSTLNITPKRFFFSPRTDI